ncbi:MAG: hypothetical protein Kow0092_40130 [Deferrisomatales bacterium]
MWPRGVIVQRSRFCVFGAMIDRFGQGRSKRALMVLAAVAVFGLVNLVGDRHRAEYPGALFLAGGVVQAVGYALGRGCPPTLPVRLGEGSRLHLAVFVGLLAGVGLYTGFFARSVEAFLGPCGA